MYIPYNKKLKQKARKLRNYATPEENKLWYQYLSKHKKRFLRQKIIDNYIVDFYCPEKKLVIEVDGSQHFTKNGLEYDKIRTDILSTYSIKVIRLTNYDIRKNFEEVCIYIEKVLKEPLSQSYGLPPPLNKGGFLHSFEESARKPLYIRGLSTKLTGGSKNFQKNS